MNTMQIEQIYTGCLAQGAYYITSAGKAAIIDPLRETKTLSWPISKGWGETQIYFWDPLSRGFCQWTCRFEQTDRRIDCLRTQCRLWVRLRECSGWAGLKVGDITIVVLHTPGHTMESTTFLLRDETGKDTAIFSGDTLFLGDVGRPDLAQKAANMTQEGLAGLLYDSLMNKIVRMGRCHRISCSRSWQCLWQKHDERNGRYFRQPEEGQLCLESAG